MECTRVSNFNHQGAANGSMSDPLSITGSIGVFASLPNISGFSKKIGLNSRSTSKLYINLMQQAYQFGLRAHYGVSNPYLKQV